MSFFKTAIDKVKLKTEEAQMRTPVQKALFKAITNLDVIPAMSDMQYLAEMTAHYDEARTIISYIQSKLKKDGNRRVIIRTLDLVSFLIKNGPKKIISEFRDDKYHIKSMRNITPLDDEYQEVDVIKNKAKEIINLLENEELLEEEREKAAKINQRYAAVGSSGKVPGFGAQKNSYEGMGSSGNNFQSKREFSGENHNNMSHTSSTEVGSFTKGGLYDDYSTKQSSLRAKLGLDTEKDTEKKTEHIPEEKLNEAITKVFEKPKKEPNFLDGEEDLKKTVKSKGLPAPPKSKKFLPPPPIKGASLPIDEDLFKNESNRVNSNFQDDLINLDLVGGSPEINKPKTNISPNNGGLIDLMNLGNDSTVISNNGTGGLQQQNMNNLMEGLHPQAPVNQGFGGFQQSQGFGGFQQSQGFGGFSQPPTNQGFGGFQQAPVSQGFGGGFSQPPTNQGFGGFQQAPVSQGFGGFQQAPVSQGFGGVHQTPVSQGFGGFQQAPASQGFGGSQQVKAPKAPISFYKDDKGSASKEKKGNLNFEDDLFDLSGLKDEMNQKNQTQHNNMMLTGGNSGYPAPNSNNFDFGNLL